MMQIAVPWFLVNLLLIIGIGFIRQQNPFELMVLGLLIGMPGIYISGQAIRGLLIDVSPFDAPTLIATATGLVTVTLFACYLAARRVTTIEPSALLRDGG